MNDIRSGAEIQGSKPAGTRGFWALIITQFQGAFSDNALKQLALFIGISLGFKEREQDGLIMLSLALLTLPFIFFSMFGGSLATRFSKRSVTIAIKCFEIVVMLVATIGLAYQALSLVLVCLFFMGVHSAIFGPSPKSMDESLEIVPVRESDASALGTSATVLVALALSEGTPAATRAGKVTNEPPPAIAFMPPPTAPGSSDKQEIVHSIGSFGLRLGRASQNREADGANVGVPGRRRYWT